ncbi:MAG: hypothetical protein JWO78_2504 [Micavibrio sp.]|nr:hypothetical protein [Micavibrio sp.]
MPTQQSTKFKSAPKDQIYEEILPQIASLVNGEDDLITTLADITALLSQSFGQIDRERINIVDALYLERVFDLLQRKYCAGNL